jgi:histidine triad (HIT) family protein
VSLAFLDHRPLFPGHCLLITKDHIETLSDLPIPLIAPLFTSAQLLARAVEKGLLVEGTFVAMNNRVSQSVAHLHVHIVPRRKKDGLKGFFWPRQSYRDQEHLTSVQESLRAAILELQSKVWFTQPPGLVCVWAAWGAIGDRVEDLRKLWEKGICRTKVVFDEEGVQSMQPDLGLVAFVLDLGAVHLRTNYQHRSSPMWPRRSN